MSEKMYADKKTHMLKPIYSSLRPESKKKKNADLKQYYIDFISVQYYKTPNGHYNRYVVPDLSQVLCIFKIMKYKEAQIQIQKLIQI